MQRHQKGHKRLSLEAIYKHEGYHKRYMQAIYGEHPGYFRGKLDT